MTLRKLFSMLVVFTLLVGMVPVNALATEVEEIPSPAEPEAEEAAENPIPEIVRPSVTPEQEAAVELMEETPLYSGDCSSYGSDVRWALYPNGELRISGTGAMYGSAASSNIPWSDHADSITSVIIENGVTSIGSHAFYSCKNLTNVSIPHSVTSIGWAAFQFCSSLTGITIPGSVTSIGNEAFYGCGLINVTLSEGVTSIGNEAFGSCNLVSVALPSSVSRLGSIVFGHCVSLTNIYVSNKNPYFSSLDGVLFDKAGDVLLQFPAGREGGYIVPDGVITIGQQAFSRCQALTSVTLPTSVTTIEDEAFSRCPALTSITLPGSVTTIGSSAFESCYALASITIPESVTTIGNSAFYHCDSLTRVTVPGNITTLGSLVFAWCNTLDSVTFSDGVTYIGEYMFNMCTRLTSVTIPVSVTDIDNYAFYGCLNLADVYYGGSPESWNEILIGVCNEYLKKRTEFHYGNDSTLNTSSDVNGVNPEVSKLYITGFSRRELVMDGVQDKAIAVFNQNIAKGDTDRGIAFWDADTGQMVTLLPIENENIRASANCLTIDVGALDIPGGRTYYITIPPGAVESTNGDIFYGLEDKNSWVVTIPQDLSVDGVTMAWAQNGWFPLFKENDYTKPPIPAGSDREYGALLSDWAWNCGYSLSESEAQALLDEPVYLPVTSDGKSFLLDDKATTVRQVMEDIIFTANLQPYLEDLDNLLAETENSTGADSGWGQIAEILSGETEAYELAASWYDQVDRYMTGRASESNFFLSLGAPIAYKLLMDKVTSGQIGPVAKAQLALVENEYALSTIGGMETYAQFKEAVKDVGTAGQGLSAAYTAYVDGNPKNLVRFGFDLLEEHWTETGNGMLTELVGAYQEISSAKSAVQLCMFLGSSIGYFPMVVDLYQDLNNSRYSQVKTAYFLADYYVAEKDPDLYDTILGLDDGMLHSSTYVWNNFSSEDALNYELALDRGERSSDPVIANWARFINTGGMVDLDGADIAMLRRDITNYATILRYAKSIDTTSTIEALVGYLKTEAEQGNRTAVAVSCPVVVNIYDADNQLVASLSSEHEEIADNRFGTLYLLGENGETKYFYLNSADYRAEIVPYDAGTMDVTITQMSAEGNADSVYYEDVQLSPDMVISTDIWISEDSALTVTGSSGTIKPESEIPVSFLEVNGPEEVAVGSSAVLTAVVGPVAATSKTVTWNSSEPSILSVTPDGTVSALAEGSAVITCTTNSGITASMAISTYLPATSLTCNTEAVSMLVGESCPLSVTVEGGAGRPISWRSSNASVISVDQSGTINALSAGTAVVTAEADGLTVDIRVTAGLAPLAVSLYQSDMGEMQLKMDLTNLSLEQNFAETIYLALYHGAKMEGLISIPSGLAPGETRTVYYPLTALSEGGTYSVSAFILDGDCVPYQIKTTQTLIP